MQACQYFSGDYASARQKFLAAARTAGAEIESFENPCSGDTRFELFTDVALLGPADAGNCLVLISGTHGVEGFAGSATQTGLLLGGISLSIPLNTRVVMIHALNPYGFAALRRCNEDNVDLNRNFVGHDGTYPENPGYRDLSDAIAPRLLSFPVNILSMLSIYRYRLLRGRDMLQQAVTHGQYAYPQGLFYGGSFAVWSNRLLHELSARYLARASRVIAIDVHTGLGLSGRGELIMKDAVGAPAYQRAVEWWGKEHVTSTVDGHSVSAHLSGTVNLALARMLPATEVTAVGLEFGTLPPMAVFAALRAENWLYHHGGLQHPQEAEIKKKFLRAFYPEDPLWKHKVWEQGQRVVEQALSAFIS
jgi:hypothetical protein